MTFDGGYKRLFLNFQQCVLSSSKLTFCKSTNLMGRLRGAERQAEKLEKMNEDRRNLKGSLLQGEGGGGRGGPEEKVFRAEADFGYKNTFTCELCQKETKTLQSLYTHVIVHIRVELERRAQHLMEGFKCKLCDRVFKAKVPLINHIGCKHGGVNEILKERGCKEMGTFRRRLLN